MGVVETQRTLVKSVPELWAELSEAALLGPMLEHFGEITITRLEPEASIEWQSEVAAGRVELAPSAFGTRVRLTARLRSAQAAVAPAAEPTRPGLLARLFGARPVAPAAAREGAANDPQAFDPRLAQGALTALLDEIGAARHRPFARDVEASRQTA
ncbi:MAG: hypothetical protein ABSD82_07085 [Solirubrobacteraceae bacterium]|jgi:hypothetical protein